MLGPLDSAVPSINSHGTTNPESQNFKRNFKCWEQDFHS